MLLTLDGPTLFDRAHYIDRDLSISTAMLPDRFVDKWRAARTTQHHRRLKRMARKISPTKRVRRYMCTIAEEALARRIRKKCRRFRDTESDAEIDYC